MCMSFTYRYVWLDSELLMSVVPQQQHGCQQTRLPFNLLTTLNHKKIINLTNSV